MKYSSLIFILTSFLVFSGCGSPARPASELPQSAAPGTAATDITDTDRLKAAIFAFANKKTAGEWDKVYTITEEDASGVSALGTWKKGQIFPWVGFKQSNGDWKIMLGSPRFDCSDIKTIPQTLKNRFKNTLYPDGSTACN